MVFRATNSIGMFVGHENGKQKTRDGHEIFKRVSAIFHAKCARWCPSLEVRFVTTVIKTLDLFEFC